MSDIMDNFIIVVLVINIFVDLFLLVSCHSQFEVVCENSKFIADALRNILENCKKEDK